MKDIQTQASNPDLSSLVSASAGTGKTKMLVDRLIRLLLNGIEPESILCLTFTKAAASEMMDRLLNLLEKLTLMNQAAFQAFLLDIDEPYAPQKNQIRKTLYFDILNLEGGLKIQTLHSFCQGLIESNIWALNMSPPLAILDDHDRTEYLERAIHQIFLADEWKNTCNIISQKMSYNRFMDLIKDTVTLPYQDLEKARKPFPVGNLSDTIQTITRLIHSLPPEIQSQIPTNEKKLFSFFLTQDGKARKSILKKSILSPYPTTQDTLLLIADHFETVLNARKTDAINHLNDNFFGLCHRIKEQFQNDKHQASGLDFNDLIEKAHDLLKHPDSGNLERILGYRLNAILVDEAQDTSPLQWGIIDDLVHNMLMADAHGLSTVFIVGDLKQSIYSFQGSRPDLFTEKSVHYHTLFQEYHKKFKIFDLDTSYRSSVHVLHAVDTVFNTHKHGVVAIDAPPLIHRPHRQHAPGGVYIAPLENMTVDREKNHTWQLPHDRQTDQTQTAELGQKIAWCVMDILSKTTSLHATNAPPQPQDIMILVRSRNTLVEAIHQALLSYNIPVSGLDRFQLNDHIIVQDLLCLAEWLCALRNDYALACLLKSPLFGTQGQGIDETDLHTLCTHQEEACLWEVLCTLPKEVKKSQDLIEFKTFLLHLIDNKNNKTLTAFFMGVWQEKCHVYIQHYGMEAVEIFDAFYDQIYHIEHQKSPTMQEFIWHFHNLDVWIKKDVASKIYPQVRLMTVHGSKGLQAPIVILADANFQTTLRQEERLYIDNRYTLKPADSESPNLFLDQKKLTLQTILDEERRLLYVAMTRAEDELYIFGKGSKIVQNSWYDIVSQVSDEASIQRYEPDPTTHIFKHTRLGQDAMTIAPYFKSPIPKNLLKQPDFVQNEEAANRGSIIHKLFEILPHTESMNYNAVIKRILNDIDHKNQITERDIAGIIKIMHNPLYSPFLSAGGLNELSLTYNGQLYRIDRVILQDDRAYILDFKTGTRTASKLNTYKKQVYHYGKAIEKNYSISTLKHYLLWIDSWTLEYLEDLETMHSAEIGNTT